MKNVQSVFTLFLQIVCERYTFLSKYSTVTITRTIHLEVIAGAIKTLIRI